MNIENTNEEAECVLGLLKLKRIYKNSKYTYKGYKYKTPFQLKILYKIFSITNYPSSKTRSDLAILLDMPPRSIQIWFQNTRQNLRDLVNIEEEGPVQKFKKSNTSYKDISSKELINILFEEKNH